MEDRTILHLLNRRKYDNNQISMVNMCDVKEKGQQTSQTERHAMDRVFSKKLACLASHTNCLGYHYKYNVGMLDAVSSIRVQFQLIY